jgi:hypothetical protein
MADFRRFPAAVFRPCIIAREAAPRGRRHHLHRRERRRPRGEAQEEEGEAMMASELHESSPGVQT